MKQQQRREAAEKQTRYAERTGDYYSKLIAEGLRYSSKQDYRKAAKACREAIALEPDEPLAYVNLGAGSSTSRPGSAA